MSKNNTIDTEVASGCLISNPPSCGVIETSHYFSKRNPSEGLKNTFSTSKWSSIAPEAEKCSDRIERKGCVFKPFLFSTGKILDCLCTSKTLNKWQPEFVFCQYSLII